MKSSQLKRVLKGIRNKKSGRVCTGITSLDDRLGGLKNGNVYVIGARRGIGATSLACSIMRNVAEGGDKVTYFTVSKAEDDPIKRLAAQGTGMAVQLMGDEEVYAEQLISIEDEMKLLKHIPINIDDTQGHDVVSLLDRIVIFDSYLDSKLIILDGLQFLSIENAYQTRREELEAICREIKSVAGMLEVPIIVTANLPDSIPPSGIDAEKNNQLTLSDLDAYGNISEIVDYVLLLNREEFYFPDTEKKGIMTIDIAKADNYEHGQVEVAFLPEYMKCIDLKRQ